MGKAPAFQFYPSDWLEKRVLRMSDAAQGVYLRLLCYMWNDSRDQCSIENNDKIITKLLGISSRKWKKYRAEIQWANDPILIEHNGFLYSKRLQKEKEKQQIKSEKAKQSADARWKRTQCERTDQAGNSHGLEQCSSFSSSTSSLEPLSSKEEGYTLPSKEEISESSIPKLRSDIKKLCDELYNKKIFPKAHAWANSMLKYKANERAVIHTLVRCYVKSQAGGFDEKGPWGYCTKIIQVENGNFNERDYKKTA